MKKIYILFTAIGIFIISMSSTVYESIGIEGYTGSPSEGTCRTCHSDAPLNDSKGSITITAPTLINWNYTPGETYLINVTITRTGAKVFGFDFEALTTTNVDAGTLSRIGNDQTLLISKAKNGRTNAIHITDGGNTPNTHTFSFNWTAPNTSVGTITFYATGNATNNNGNTSGDYVYATKQTLSNTVNVIEQMKMNNNISIYPNPANEYVYIKNVTDVTEQMNVSFIDISGKVILTKRNLNSNSTINIAALSTGNYLVKIEKNSNIVVKKMIKN
jgi:hypothetical protein